MNKLDELIQELCPDGVEYKSFGDCAKIVRGASPRPIKNFITTEPDGVNWIKIGDVKPGEKYITSSAEKITLDGAKKSRPVKKGDFILSNSMSFGRPYILKIDGCVHDGWLAISEFSDSYVSDFLYYLLSSNMCQNQMKKKASFGGAVQNLNADIVRELSLPVPPLEVQQEIVYLLDDFTAKTAELQDKLNEELETRKKQYEYYRNLLLNANKSNTVMKLGDVADVGVGNKPVEILNDSTDYEYINAGTTNSGYTHEWNCSGDTVTTPSRGQGGIGFVGYQSNSFWLGPLCYKIKSNKDWVTTKYLYYILSNSTEELLSLKKTGGVPALNRSDLIQMKISIPSLEEQNHIVDILDQFDSTYNNLKITLPTEIESRQKQYEFYRDKLLTFKELNESEVN